MPNKVYVINKHGRPLMPCSPAKARHLLDAGKAKVKKRTPFTIQLVYGSSGYTQEVILGVDAGSKTIGVSALTKKEELFAANVIPRNDVVDLLSTRREFRRARRNCKTRYRKPRFDNRVRSKHKGWLAPSVEVKIQEHITTIRRVYDILPVSKVVVETAEFDLQLLKALSLIHIWSPSRWSWRDIARHIPGQLHRDGDRRQIHELNAQLDLQRVDEVPLRNEAVLHQHVAQTLVGLLLDGQGLIQLFLRDDAGGDQQIAQPHICHIYHSKIRAAPFFSRQPAPCRRGRRSFSRKRQVFSKIDAFYVQYIL